MEQSKYKEMTEKLDKIENDVELNGKRLLLFGHCNATEELADLLISKGYRVDAILDNNSAKHGKDYRGIKIAPVEHAVAVSSELSMVLIVTRFYESMSRQLRSIGFAGRIEKLVDYNTFARYSLDRETIAERKSRLQNGLDILEELAAGHKGCMRVFCPFAALGDVYFCMEYLPLFLRSRGFDRAVVLVPNESCQKVVSLFGPYDVEVLPQAELDAAIQAVIFSNDEMSFIAHQDRPYVVDLSRALYLRKIPLETIYEKGVFGLEGVNKPAQPACWRDYPELEQIEEGKSVILSPYAKSVTALSGDIWKGLADDFRLRGYCVYTNVYGDEKPVEGTMPISPKLNEMKSVVERAGLFVGIRSGLCDILRTANCRKVALYPDYFYCDTKWKSIDMYSIEGFENIVVEDGITWEELKERIMK